MEMTSLFQNVVYFLAIIKVNSANQGRNIRKSIYQAQETS